MAPRIPPDAVPRPVAPRRGLGAPWLPAGISLTLHAAALAAVLLLLPDALAPPAREHGVEILWQDVPEDSLATAERSASPAAPPSIAAPPAPEAPPLPP
ncbi:MAG: hypothetical protein K2X49_28620, partial [Acetobacteraceae bacterium]|nr:hypothetical protein [Acetobacteraceae bacterium]